MKNRRNPFRPINVSLQLKYSIIFSLIAMISSLLPVFIFYRYINNTYQEAIQTISDLYPNLALKLSLEHGIISNIIIVIIVVFVILSFLLGFYFGGRIYGPIYAFKRAINRLYLGIESKFSLRKGDDLKELEELYDKIIKMLEKNK